MPVSDKTQRLKPLRLSSRLNGRSVGSLCTKVNKGQMTFQSLQKFLGDNPDDLLRFASCIMSRITFLRTSSEMEHMKKFLASVIQKYPSQQQLVSQANKSIHQIDQALTRLRQQGQKFWTKHTDLKQMLQKRVYDPVQMQQRQLRTVLRTDSITEKMTIFVMPDNTLVMTPQDWKMTFQCDGRAYSQYMHWRQGQPEPRMFYHFSGTQQIYVDSEDYDKHYKLAHQTKSPVGDNHTIIMFLSPDVERIPTTISFDAVSRWNFVGEPHCNDGTSINVHKIHKIVVVPPPFVL